MKFHTEALGTVGLNYDQLFWCWRRNSLALGVNTMSADALAPKVTRTSAGMILTV